MKQTTTRYAAFACKENSMCCTMCTWLISFQQAKEADDDYRMWQDEEFVEQKHEASAEYVMVDAHILCTPAIADLDGDGKALRPPLWFPHA